ncbi:MAG: dephospho-CoA kinase [Deltaproteobacteria bacterium]|nr:dephospho-CoA kinase [Deltaproteobacteria bacterium]
MTVVGLTGGIACGKSTVASFFAALGVPVVDADALAREVVAPGTPGLEEIVARFGSEVLDAEGELNRAALGEIVFADAEARRALEAITHPRIAALGQRRLATLAAENHSYALYEAALLVEKGLHRAFGALVVVATSPATQIERLMARDGLSRAAAQSRVDAQLPMTEKVELADFVIQNDGDREQTRAEVALTHRALSRTFASNSAGEQP